MLSRPISTSIEYCEPHRSKRVDCRTVRTLPVDCIKTSRPAMSHAPSISYRDVGVAGLGEIQSSWESLRDYHVPLSACFADDIRRLSFVDRRAELRHKAREGEVRVDVATLESIGRCVGYCISSRSGTVGEIESLHVVGEFRSHGIGTTFMRRALAWFDLHRVTKRQVSLLVENDAAARCYQRFGFRPGSITMQQAFDERSQALQITETPGDTPRTPE